MCKAKKFSVVLSFFLIVSPFLACQKGGKPADDAVDKDTSYAFGMLLASQLGAMGFMDIRFDYGAFMEGFKAFNEAGETRLTPNDAMEKINAVFARLQAQNDEDVWLEGEKNREEGEAYLEENGARSGVITTSSGLQYEIITQGSGAKPGQDDTVRVHYEGTLIDGTVFDSSYQRGAPVEFPLDEVIDGWIEGIQLMNEGSTYRFVVPSDLAYGQGGSRSIPPNATLIFKVELLGIVE